MRSKNFRSVCSVALPALLLCVSLARAGESDIDNPDTVKSVRCRSDVAASDLQVDIRNTGERKFRVRVRVTRPLARDVEFDSGISWSGHFWVFQSRSAVLRTRERDADDGSIALLGSGSSRTVIAPLHCLVNP